ncbi:MAG: ATP-binding protein [Acidimicrobiaceae bacterium]|nr:ATP-binding protein [Acidimicrobiaceae bacterium]MDE2895555.1 ATP-binding protein [Chloroflexota bacterium]
MEQYERSQVGVLVDRLDEPVERIITIVGPRQCGKTTMVRQALAKVSYPYRYEAVDLLEPSATTPIRSAATEAPASVVPRDTAWLARVWRECAAEAHRLGTKYVLVLDEVQKIPQWSETVKGLWDADRASGCPLHVVVLGSAPMRMQSGLTESLAGRFESIRATHWSFAEMRDAFGFGCDEFVFYGGYPGATRYRGSFGRWRDYVRDALIEPHVERDILDIARVDKPALLRQLLELGCLYSGQELAYRKMRGQLEDAGHESTLARYLRFLSDAGLVTGLFKHSDKPILRRSSSPKLNVLNTALMSAVVGDGFEDARADRSHWGRVVESAVGAHLINTASSATNVRYWRDGDDEIDFVLQRGQRLVGIEVKAGRRRPRRSRIESFERRFSASPTVVVGEAGVQLHEFLLMPADHWLGSS